MTTLIAEDVQLMLLDDSGAFVSSDNRKPALAGAVLAELALIGAVEIETEKGLWKRAKVVVEDPDERTATVIAVLVAAEVLPKVVDRGSMSKKELKKRADTIAEGGWATEAVRKAIQAAQAAVMAGITAMTVGAAAAGS